MNFKSDDKVDSYSRKMMFSVKDENLSRNRKTIVEGLRRL